MATATLKSLHACLRLLENPAELKRRMPSTLNQRTVKEGQFELGKLIGLDCATLVDPQTIAAMIGPQRFVMIGGEPSLTDRVARIFDSTRVLLSVMINPARVDKPPTGDLGTISGGALQQAAANSLSPNRGRTEGDLHPGLGRMNPEQEDPMDNLKPLLAGNLPLACRLFRALFESVSTARSLPLHPIPSDP